MPFDLGTTFAIAAVLLFYLRLIILQRQRAKEARRAKQARHAKETRRSKQAPSNRANPSNQPASLPWVVIKNAYLVGFGVLLLGIGAVISMLSVLGPEVQAWWWVPVTLGILLMGLGIG